MKLITNRLQVKSKTSAYTVLTSDDVILCNGTFTVTLPPIARCINKVITIKNTGTGVITIDGDGSETIDGKSNATLRYKNDALDIVSNGSTWNIIRCYTTPPYYTSSIANILPDGTIGVTPLASLQISSTGRMVEVGLIPDMSTITANARVGILRDQTYSGTPSPMLSFRLTRDSSTIGAMMIQYSSKQTGGSTSTGIGFVSGPTVVRWFDDSITAGTHTYTIYWNVDTTTSRVQIIDCKFYAREV